MGDQVAVDGDEMWKDLIEKNRIQSNAGGDRNYDGP